MYQTNHHIHKSKYLLKIKSHEFKMKIVEKMTALLQFFILSMDPPLLFPCLQFNGEMYSASFALKVKINISAGTCLQYFL